MLNPFLRLGKRVLCVRAVGKGGLSSAGITPGEPSWALPILSLSHPLPFSKGEQPEAVCLRLPGIVIGAEPMMFPMAFGRWLMQAR